MTIFPTKWRANGQQNEGGSHQPDRGLLIRGWHYHRFVPLGSPGSPPGALIIERLWQLHCHLVPKVSVHYPPWNEASESTWRMDGWKTSLVSFLRPNGLFSLANWLLVSGRLRCCTMQKRHGQTRPDFTSGRKLGVGFTYSLFSFLFGEMIQFDLLYIFQMGWSHQHVV